MKEPLFVLLFLLSITVSQAQQQIIPLWNEVAPGSEKWNQKEVQYKNEYGQDMIRNVVTPTLTVYKPDPEKATGTAVVVAPGGGFLYLSWQSEGTEVAEWLVNKGITVFLLKYRLTNSGDTEEDFQKNLEDLYKSIDAANNSQAERYGNELNDSMSQVSILGQEDGRQAIRLIRSRAIEWGIDPHKIGIMGFSAGGMVTLGPLLDHDEESCPDFAGTIYTPWSGGIIPDDAPPLFILVAGDDGLAAPGSVQLYMDYKNANKQAELHIYSSGGHGFGMVQRGIPVDSWIERFYDWLQVIGF